jgi:hypothetical protein
MNTNVPKKLPDSRIIVELSEKAYKKKDSRISHLARLDDLRESISQEVKYIVQIFPEYTPHDEENHLSRLFFLADKLLGHAVLGNLNCTELFILAAALYGHDWGMAVSDSERELIALLSEEQKIQVEPSNICLLRDEYFRFKEFLIDNDIKLPAGKINSSHWQEYIRTTHAKRSGERIRKYFNTIDTGIGEAIARVCEGHWLDFEEIQDWHNYPTNYAVSGETVNLRALAVYVRLIDLFDITQERTPYVLWKYVTPRSLRSSMEWQKHAAIQSISFPPYQDGRIIQVDGGTDSHEVYAALQDLKNLCNEQLRGCNDILTQINDTRYNLNIFHVDWRVQAKGFIPISIQFEFDRTRMFEILSDEIYRGDKYVFLRELLQNSIDAINVRKSVLAKNGLHTHSIWLIDINVHHMADGNCEITFRDDGIGMDEYIVKNYLSVAGRSYYSSDDFKKLGLALDPISRFGVGVLSCFMVADEISIDTIMDPYMNTGKREQLSIHIPAIAKQFRIQSYVNPSATIGTTFKVSVLGRKLKSGITQIDKLKVTEYLCRIAGFVQIPIKINEDGRKTLIIHPNENVLKYQSLFPDHVIEKLDVRYPWEKAFLPQSLKDAKDILQEVRIDVSRDLNIAEVADGFLCFVETKNPELFMINYDLSFPSKDFVFSDKTGIVKRIRIQRQWTAFERFGVSENYNSSEFGKTAKLNEQFRIYLDGILLSNAAAPDKLFGGSRYYIDESFSEISDWFVRPFIIINFRKKALKRIDLSRTEIIEATERTHWEDVIREHFDLYTTSQALQLIERLSVDQKMLTIANLILFGRVRTRELLSAVTIDKWPVPVIGRGGELKIIEWESLKDKIVYLEPVYFSNFQKKLIEKYQGIKASKYWYDNWNSEEFLLMNSADRYNNSTSAQCSLILMLHSIVLSKTHTFRSYRFLKSHWEDGPPFIQGVWEPTPSVEINPPSEASWIEAAETAVKNFSSLSCNEFLNIVDALNFFGESFYDEFHFPQLGGFERPFDSKFSYGFEILNFHNPLVKNILRLILITAVREKKGLVDAAIINEVFDKVKDLPFFSYSIEDQRIDRQNAVIDSVFSFAAIHFGFTEIDTYRLTNDSFVPGSLIINSGKLRGFKKGKIKNYLTGYSTSIN